MKVLGIISLCIGACFAATTVEKLINDNDFTTLVGLVKSAGLVDALNGGTFTIFAPTNAAFAKIPSATLTALGNDVAALTSILKYHVVSGSVMSTAAMNELQVDTINGAKARFNIYKHNNVVTIEGSKITAFDKVASNGVIHVIDTVMMPPKGDIVDFVVANNYTTLLSLVQQAGIASALKGDNLTLFAPTNAAFGHLSTAILDKLSKNKTLLTEILTYHVVPHTEYSQGLFNRESLKTLDVHHDRVVVHATAAAGVKINNAHVTKADMSVTNGVVHEIDAVLIPKRYKQTFAAVGK